MDPSDHHGKCTDAVERRPDVASGTALRSVESDPRYIALNEETRSELVVPLVYQDRVIGVLDLEHTRRGYFNDDHVRMMTLASPKEVAWLKRAALKVNDYLFEPEEGLKVEVSVADSSGLPLGRAKVGAIQETPSGHLLHFESLSDAQGRAVLARVDARLPVTVVCIAPGYLRREQSFDVVPNAVLCPLSRTSAIQGQVLDAEDRPLAGPAGVN